MTPQYNGGPLDKITNWVTIENIYIYTEAYCFHFAPR